MRRPRTFGARRVGGLNTLDAMQPLGGWMSLYEDFPEGVSVRFVIGQKENVIHPLSLSGLDRKVIFPHNYSGMNEENNWVEEQVFYETCGELLGAPYAYEPFPYRKRTRWNNRKGGNGRYEGFGLIRLFGNTVHVCLSAPIRINRVFKSRQAALDYLRDLTTN